jgi:hypothetical protein
MCLSTARRDACPTGHRRPLCRVRVEGFRAKGTRTRAFGPFSVAMPRTRVRNAQWRGSLLAYGDACAITEVNRIQSSYLACRIRHMGAVW